MAKGSKFLMTCWLFSIVFAALSNVSVAEDKTACTGVYVANKTGVQCKDNTCSDKVRGACATCADLAISLPQGSQVVSEQCWTVAHYKDDYGHNDLHQVACGQDVAWSIFDRPVVDSSGSSVRVITTAVITGTEM
jgi:hypothetical protein